MELLSNLFKQGPSFMINKGRGAIGKTTNATSRKKSFKCIFHNNGPRTNACGITYIRFIKDLTTNACGITYIKFIKELSNVLILVTCR